MRANSGRAGCGKTIRHDGGGPGRASPGRVACTPSRRGSPATEMGTPREPPVLPASIRSGWSKRLSARAVISPRPGGERQARRPREASANSRSGKRGPSASKFSSASEGRQPVRPVRETFLEHSCATMAVTPATGRSRPRRVPRLSSASADGLVLPRELGRTPLTNPTPGGVSCCQLMSRSAVVAGAVRSEEGTDQGGG